MDDPQAKGVQQAYFKPANESRTTSSAEQKGLAPHESDIVTGEKDLGN
ncbi:MAG: hypothetical protein LBF08_07460 [Dysgonamonadaceae bacterium]|jgi:hypothetical protein|nr:hypothetical protein [Dysgonamonadaceae bacterium]